MQVMAELINKNKLPQHIAIIMDGNGRWAKKHHLPRLAGHREGAKAVREVVRACGELGIKYLTLYAFSTENWARPRKEVAGLMHLLSATLKREALELNQNNVRFQVIGRIEELPDYARRQINQVIELTKNNSGLTLNLALNYGGRQEITDAVRKLVRDGVKPENINESEISKRLYTRDMPDTDLLIRTSGEYRVSNFLLWQIAYTELYVTSVLWPDFGKKELSEAIGDYQKRERRFGR